MIWLLDTKVLIQAQKGRPGGVRERLAACSPDDVAISAITVAELDAPAGEQQVGCDTPCVTRRLVSAISSSPRLPSQTI